MEAITCEVPANSSWTNESSGIKLETNESRGYVVSIILNSEPLEEQKVLVNTDGGATTATVLHVTSTSSCSSSSSSSSYIGPSAVKERDIDVGRLSGSSSIKISLTSGNSEEQIVVSSATNNNNNMVRPDQFFYFPEAPIISGLSSPASDNNDSGAGSDFDGSTPPPLPKRKQQLSSPVDSGVSSVTTHSSSNGSITDEEEEEDSISCDSLNSSELNNDSLLHSPPQIIDTILPKFNLEQQQERLKSLQITAATCDRSQPVLQVATTTTNVITERPPPPVIKECIYADRGTIQAQNVALKPHYYDFHLNENLDDSKNKKNGVDDDVDTSFAGVHDILSDRKAIRSAKGTVRGVKNRVRAGIATFLQLEDTRSFKEREQGKLVVYTTTMGVVRSTYLRCVKVKQILRTLLVKFEERDVFMSRDTQQEIRTRMKSTAVVVPQVFLEGHHLGDSETIERLNESGELRRLLRPFKCPGASTPCAACGGYRLLPCSSCNGSKKSVHRNHFTAEFVALKCMTCDESGLMRCHTCS